MRRGDSSSFNIWLRARVILQGLTIAAALGGSVYYTADKAKIEAAKNAVKERERERRENMLDRMREQELASGRTLPPPPIAPSLPSKGQAAPLGLTVEESKVQRKEEADAKRAWIRKQMAATAKEEGRALRLPTKDDFGPGTPSTNVPRGKDGGDTLSSGRLV